MFIEALKAQNPALIEAAIKLWRQGEILPDTCVIDVDQVLANGRRLLEIAHSHGITLYLMTKQLGRNPWMAKRLIELGFHGTVAVDFKEARTLRNADVPVSHVGHLVQVPTSLVTENVVAPTEIITVFSLEKAQEISNSAQRLGLIQPIMLKIFDEKDKLYPGQEAGFALPELTEIVAAIGKMPGVKISGLTHFPCLLWDDELQKTLPTQNLQTLLLARDKLRSFGVEVTQLNAPSATSCSTLSLLAEYGVTHAEPGHALTGTIPANQYGDQPERIAMLYLTEISHQFQGNSYCFGGGYYRRGHAQNALVYPAEGGDAAAASVLPMDNCSIDYHIGVAGKFPPGAPVVMCFRTQVFVTRSDVALISGISRGKPVLEALYDSLGNPLSGGLRE